jgi:hypothetical protein
MASRQILTLLLAHHGLNSAVPNALGSLKDLLDEAYSGATHPVRTALRE